MPINKCINYFKVYRKEYCAIVLFWCIAKISVLGFNWIVKEGCLETFITSDVTLAIILGLMFGFWIYIYLVVYFPLAKWISNSLLGNFTYLYWLFLFFFRFLFLLFLTDYMNPLNIALVCSILSLWIVTNKQLFYFFEKCFIWILKFMFYIPHILVAFVFFVIIIEKVKKALGESLFYSLRSLFLLSFFIIGNVYYVIVMFLLNLVYYAFRFIAPFEPIEVSFGEYYCKDKFFYDHAKYIWFYVPFSAWFEVIYSYLVHSLWTRKVISQDQHEFFLTFLRKFIYIINKRSDKSTAILGFAKVVKIRRESRDVHRLYERIRSSNSKNLDFS